MSVLDHLEETKRRVAARRALGIALEPEYRPSGPALAVNRAHRGVPLTPLLEGALARWRRQREEQRAAQLMSRDLTQRLLHLREKHQAVRISLEQPAHALARRSDRTQLEAELEDLAREIAHLSEVRAAGAGKAAALGQLVQNGRHWLSEMGVADGQLLEVTLPRREETAVVTVR